MSAILNDLLKKIANEVFVNEKVSDEEYIKRFEICKSCKNFNNKKETCNLCGCFMEIKAKSQIHFNAKKLRKEITHCPEGYWGDIDTANYYKELESKKIINN